MALLSKINQSKFETAVKKLKNIRIIVIGDLILDEYLIGDVNRISPEAPVPVVHIKKESMTLGGSGNVIKNLNVIGVQSIVFGRSGKDIYSDKLHHMLVQEGVKEEDLHILVSDTVPTTIKTRVIAQNQQVCRVDREKVIPISQSEEVEIIQSLKKTLGESDGIILSDYDKGYLTPTIIENTLRMSVEANKYASADPQVSHFFQYKNISIMTPNHHEAGRALGRNIQTDTEVEEALREICNRLESPSMMITRGDKGMSIYNKDTKQVYHVPTIAREVYDVTGAGDTVISVFTAFKLAGLTELESSVISNAAASVVVAKLGASTADIDEIRSALNGMDLFE